MRELQRRRADRGKTPERGGNRRAVAGELQCCVCHRDEEVSGEKLGNWALTWREYNRERKREI